MTRNYKVITPDWITESVQQSKLLDWRKYQLQPTTTTQPNLLLMLNSNSAQTTRTTPTTQTMDMESLSALGSTLLSSTVQPPPLSALPPNGSIQHPWLPSVLPSSTSPSRTMLHDPQWLANHTSAHGKDFLKGYFAQSRLHHLSSWKQELRDLVRDWNSDRAGQGQGDGKKPRPKHKIKGTPEDASWRTVMHVDFDCFFVACGLVNRPHLRGKAVAVCHAGARGSEYVERPPGARDVERPGGGGKGGGGGERGTSSTSEIASCSYEAREKGVRNGMS